MPSASRACFGNFSFLQLREQAFHVFAAEVFVEVVVDLHDGCVRASPQTLDLREGEASVGGCLKVADTKRFFDTSHDKVASAQHTGGRHAALEVIGADGLAVDHRVEACDLFQTQACHAQHHGDRVHGGVGDAVRALVLPLRKVEQREHGALSSSFGILGDLFFRALGKSTAKGKPLGRGGRGGRKEGGGSRHLKNSWLENSWRRLLSVDFAEDDIQRA